MYVLLELFTKKETGRRKIRRNFYGKDRKNRMTKEEFLESFKIKSGFSAHELEICGIVAAPCDCGLIGCPGWTLENRASRKDNANASTISIDIGQQGSNLGILS